MRPTITLLIPLILCAAGPASAQPTYRCDGAGGVRYSDRPCETERDRQQHVALSTVAPLRKQDDHLKYMNAACASLSEAVRTGPLRGINPALMAALRNEYLQRCSGEETIARERLALAEARRGFQPLANR